MTPVDDPTVERYLARIGADRPRVADVDALHELTAAHVLRVPFENLDLHLPNRPIQLDENVLTKIVGERRGGGCYEVNSAFGRLLGALGYRVRVLPAQVARTGSWSAPFCHMVLRVDLDEPWLVDVGFGRVSRWPLRLRDRSPQRDPHGEFQLVDTGDGDVEVRRDGRTQYRAEWRPRQLADFEPTLWWIRTAPDSPFLRSSFCVLHTEDGRHSLTGRTLTTVDSAGRRCEVLDDEAYLARLRDVFGVLLDTMPTLPEDAAGAQQSMPYCRILR